MIQSVSITPVYNNGENLEAKQITGFGIYIMCGKDELFNLRYSIRKPLIY